MNFCQISMVKIVLELLYTDDKEDITAANMTAIINPTIPVGKIWNTNLLVKRFFLVTCLEYLKRAAIRHSLPSGRLAGYGLWYSTTHMKTWFHKDLETTWPPVRTLLRVVLCTFIFGSILTNPSRFMGQFRAWGGQLLIMKILWIPSKGKYWPTPNGWWSGG